MTQWRVCIQSWERSLKSYSSLTSFTSHSPQYSSWSIERRTPSLLWTWLKRSAPTLRLRWSRLSPRSNSCRLVSRSRTKEFLTFKSSYSSVTTCLSRHSTSLGEEKLSCLRLSGIFSSTSCNLMLSRPQTQSSLKMRTYRLENTIHFSWEEKPTRKSIPKDTSLTKIMK